MYIYFWTFYSSAEFDVTTALNKLDNSNSDDCKSALEAYFKDFPYENIDSSLNLYDFSTCDYLLKCRKVVPKF